MRNICLVIASLIIFGLAGYVQAEGVGTTGAQFLKIEPAARPLGMGGSFSAVADDANAIFYNPAGIARLETREFTGTYLQYFQAISYGSFACLYPLEKGAFGVGINYLGVDDIDRRSATDVDDPDGTSTPDTFGAMDTAVSVAYARENVVPSLLEGLDLGANLRMIYQTIDDESSFSAMFDIAGFYPVNDKLSLGLNVQNIGSNVKFREESDPLPLNVKVGAAFKPVKGLTVACDINEYVIDQILYASVGAEYWIKEVVGLRAGYKYGYDTDSLGSNVGLAGGMGFRISNIGLDYTFAPFGELGDTHRVSFLAKL
jgi:hypothetical protein